MKIKAVLFDLDGTLLPMEQEAFMKAYFGSLSATLAPHGYPPAKELVAAIWAGTAAMVKNDGSKTNENAFWDAFAALLGEQVRADIPIFDAYYRDVFPGVKASCGYDARAAKVVALCRARGFSVALATNPVFPAVATEERIRWAGLTPSDFAFFSTYENSRHCKPNPDYYRDVANGLGLSPAECLMVGNDVKEDMVAATVGMQVFLLTDCLINKENADISCYPCGGFAELADFIQKI